MNQSTPPQDTLTTPQDSSLPPQEPCTTLENSSASAQESGTSSNETYALSRLRDVHRRLEVFASLCLAAEDAVAKEDIDQLLDLAFSARQMRHAISTTANTKLHEHTVEAALLIAESRLASVQAKAGDALLHQLHDRALPDDVELLASAIGIVSFVEGLLPMTWNYAEDLILIFGNGLDAPAEVLRRLGQKRICVYLAEGEEPEHYGDEVFVIRQETDLQKLIVKWGARRPRRIVTRTLSEGSISREEQEEVVAAADLYLGYAQVDQNTCNIFADQWIAQGIENLATIAESPSVAWFNDDFADRPLVIVGPGPSLSKNIAQLHKFKDKAIICTFSRTLSALRAEGITPDIVMTVDSSELQYLFKDFPIESVGAMISGATVVPSLFKMDAPRHISMGANAGFDEWLAQLLDENFLVPGGGSVATSALSLGLKWKCDPIILMGMDLSFPGGRHYIETTADGDLKVTKTEDGKLLFEGWSEECLEMRANGAPIPEDIQETFELDGYYGGKVPTNRMFWFFHDWFEKKALEVEGVTLLNCTEGGSYIDGMEHIPLEQAYQSYVQPAEAIAFGDVLDRRIATFDGRSERVHKGVEELAGIIERCLSLTGRCEHLAQRALEDHSLLGELTKLEERLSESLAECRFMGISKQEEIELAYNRAAAAEEVGELISASRELYAAVRQAALVVLTNLKASLAEMERRASVGQAH